MRSRSWGAWNLWSRSPDGADRLDPAAFCRDHRPPSAVVPAQSRTQNDLHLHRPALLGPAGRGVLSGHGGVDVGVLCLAGQSGHREGLGRRGADQHDVRYPQDVATLLWVTAGPCRAGARAGQALFAQTGGPAHGPGRDRWDPSAPSPGLHPTGSRRHPGRGPGAAQLRPERAEPSLGHGRDRAPDGGGQGLPGRGPRRLEPASSGVVDRRPHPLRAGRRRRADGPLAASADGRPDNGAFGPWSPDSTPPGPSADDSAPPGCWGRWGRSGIASTTARSRASSGPCSSNCWTNTAGSLANSWRSPSSTGSRRGTTHRGGTPTARCSVPSSSKQPTPPPQLRHDHHNRPVRWTGGCSGDLPPHGRSCPTLPFRAPVVPKHVGWPVWLSVGGATPQHLRRWAG